MSHCDSWNLFAFRKNLPLPIVNIELGTIALRHSDDYASAADLSLCRDRQRPICLATGVGAPAGLLPLTGACAPVS